MPLFPEIDLSQFAEGSVGNGASPLPADSPVGVMAGINASLISMLRNFSPGDLGVCVVDDKLQLALPISLWDWYAFWERADTASILAGASTPTTLATVPNDERWLLEALRIERTSGDNDLDGVDLVYPAGYFSGDSRSRFLSLASASDGVLFWPDPGGQQTWTQYQAGPILLEPGTVLQVEPDGTGVSATVFRGRIATRRTKIIRAMVP